MSKVVSFTKTGRSKQTDYQLPAAVFGVDVPHHELLHKAYLAHAAARRNNPAKTLVRSEVRGGGRKPHPQKYTGRARAGSIRQPNWRGGGVVFGPTGRENHEIKLSTKEKRQALRQALTLQFGDGLIKVIDDLEELDGTTKSGAKLLDKIGRDRRTLVVVSEKSPLIDRSLRNLAEVKLVTGTYLSVFSLLNADTIVITKPALDEITEWLGGEDE